MMMKKKCDMIKRLKDGEKIKVLLYHHIDLDGYGTVILMKYLEKEFPNLTLQLIECNTDAERIYNDNNEMNLPMFDYIFIADLSIKTTKTAKLLESLNNGGLNIYIVDHHKTALWLNDFDYATIIPHDLDNNIITCGTSLLYDLLRYDTNNEIVFNNDYVLDFVNIVKSYDTYVWVRESNKRANDLNLLIKFTSDKNKFVSEIVNTLHNSTYVLGENDTNNSLKLSIYEELISNEIYNAKKLINFINININGSDYMFGYLYINNYYSEIGNALCHMFPGIAFIIMINANNGKVSFRSTKDVIDLTTIVKPLGGGGHKLAAGCVLPIDKYNCSIEETLYYIFSNSICPPNYTIIK